LPLTAIYLLQVLKEQLATVNDGVLTKNSLLSEQSSDFNTRRNRRNSDIQFKDGDNGQVMWGERCDFPGTEIRQVPSRGEECGKLCIEEERCTHFSWIRNDKAESNNCNLKMAQNNARASPSVLEGICGWVTARVGSTVVSSAPIPFPRLGFLTLFVVVIGLCFTVE